MLFTRRCADCGGQGVIGEAPCARCQGEGRAVQSEWIEVVVPPGVDSGSRVRLPGAGNAGRRGGPAGDLVLHVEVDAHPLFRREGADLQCEVPVTFTEAALGAHIEVPTLESPVVIEVPAGTQNGQRFRLRKRGMPRPEGGRGDLFVSVRVQVPAVTDEPSRQLLREFERRHPEEPRRDLLPARPAAKAR
jgi:molecular chaperone DnaJ